MTDKAFKLGDKVTFTEVLRRNTGSYHAVNAVTAAALEEARKKSFRKDLSVRHWGNTSAWVETGVEVPVQGIIVGKKTLSDGYTSYDGDYGNIYTPVRYFEAWEVAYSLRRKRVLVLDPVQVPEA